MIDSTKPAACEPDFYHQLVSSKLPAWVVDARPEQRRQLRQAASQRDPRLERACLAHPTVAKALVQTYGQHVQAEANLSALLATLPDLRAMPPSCCPPRSASAWAPHSMSSVPT